MRRLISLSTACVLLSTSFTHTSAQTNTIHVEIGSPTGVIVRPLIGFNSGIAGADDPKDDFSPDTSLGLSLGLLKTVINGSNH